MRLLHFLKKEKCAEPFTETAFECKRGGLIIRGTEYRPEGENLPVRNRFNQLTSNLQRKSRNFQRCRYS